MNSHQVDTLLADKLRALESLDARIADLASQIDRMRIERRDLEQEITVMRASTAPIRRLPIEILLYIFKELFHRVRDGSEWLDPSYKIADLMLVCKSWRAITINSPTLWTTINIDLEGDEVSKTTIIRQLQYVQTFMEHSKELPIDISINLDQLYAGQRRVKEHFEDNLWPLIEESRLEEPIEGDKDVFAESVEEWFYDLPWQECPIIGAYEGLCEYFLKSIAGENGCHMKRWNSLRLALPYSQQFANKLLKSLDFEAPLLRSLDVLPGNVAEDVWENHSLRASASLDRIRFEGDLPFLLIPESYGAHRVEILDISLLHGVDSLNHFSNLRYLRLQPVGRTPNLIVQPIRLPRLHHLRVGGCIPDAFIQVFNINYLPRLSLDCLGTGRLGDVPYPTANLFQVVEFVSVIPFPPVWTPVGSPRIVSMLVGLFKQLSSTATIGARDSLLPAVLSMIYECKTRGELPALRTLVKVDKEGEIVPGTDYATFSVSSAEE